MASRLQRGGALFCGLFSETCRGRPRDPVGQFFPTGEPLRAQENGWTVILWQPRCSVGLIPTTRVKG